MRHPIHRGGVRSYGRRGEGSPLRERSDGVRMPSPGAPSIGVFEHNKETIDWAKSQLNSSNIKHIDVRYEYHFLRDGVSRNVGYRYCLLVISCTSSLRVGSTKEAYGVRLRVVTEQ